ncbi:HDIG domain-containing metalloprotein [Serpentinicella alkaliphila]|uniref:Poly(A) polymerase n=1 Tax=Serpentinicella alkaliphila TaxID=1734049 RepID=A0A4R2TF91_9FIRM|nr:HDIG domain-containing metalloprotein [Serpentinicella alkaliphila]QUH25106.1 CCA tRNA nucleotidyltransferase [Serpentinicella alkaliphila]TCQ01751.1 poly(A) polymerase [Serpentinicella alkaliphila]
MRDYLTFIIETINTIEANTYIVGGTVRNFILGRTIEDIDFVICNNTHETIEKIGKALNGSYFILDEQRKTYRIHLKEYNINLDFSEMRGNSIEEDLGYRDFTINAMAYPTHLGLPMKRGEIIDPHNGKLDLDRGIIQLVNDRALDDDPIRIMRAVRLMSQLEFEVDEHTLEQLKGKGHLITTIAKERIINELFLILAEKRSYFYLNFMDKHIKILDKLFPEVIAMKGVGECKYHVVDSWTHSIYTLKMIESYIYANSFFEEHIKKAYEEHTNEILAGRRTRLQLLKLGALFHDIGKPSARFVDKDGRVRFRGHEITGADIVKNYADDYKLSNKEKHILSKYVFSHMWPLNLYKCNDVSGKSLYEMFCETGTETLDILLIGLADIVATRKLLDPEEEMGIFKVHVEYIANNYLTRYKDVEDISKIISGKEVMNIINIPEGKEVGIILEKIRKAMFFGEISASKEGALKYLKNMLGKKS